MTWAEKQPKDGEIMLHCGHAEDARHFFNLPDRVPFTRPDGTRGEADWIVCCSARFTASEGDALRVRIRGDGTWTGNDPVIRQGS